MKPKIAVRWSFLTQITQFTLFFVVNVTLSRILTPSDFGTFAIVNIFIGFISTIKDFGIGSFLINKQELTNDIKNTVFLINLTVILFLCGLLLLSSSSIAHFYNDDRLKVFIPLCSISLFIDGLTVIPDSMLQKNMNFHHLFIIRAASQVVGGVVAIGFALNHWGVYSLIFQSIVASTIAFLLLYYYFPFVPNMRMNKTLLRSIFSFSGPVFLDSIVQFWTRNIDNLLVGKIFGAGSLGIYNRAYTLMQLPTSNLSSVVSRVLFPYLSKNQNDISTAASVYVKTIRSIALISFPLMMLLFICSGDIIFFLYGDKWMGVVPLLKFFAIAGAIESILSPLGSLFMALGKTSKMFRVSTAIRLITISFIVFGSFYSIKLIAVCYLIATFITAPIVIKACCSLLKIKMSEFLIVLFPVFIITIVSGAGAFVFLKFVLPAEISSFPKLAFTSLLFSLIYVSLSFKYSKNSFIALFKS